MVRLADLPEWERAHMLGKIPALPAIGLTPWVAGGPLARRRVALVTSAGVHRRGDRPFGHGAARNDYRVIPRGTPPADIAVDEALRHAGRWSSSLAAAFSPD